MIIHILLIIILLQTTLALNTSILVNNEVMALNKLGMKVNTKIDWSDVKKLKEAIDNCVDSSQSVFSWVSSTYMEYLVVEEMLKNSFNRDHKKYKIKTMFIKLAYLLLGALKPKSGKEALVPACQTELEKYKGSFLSDVRSEYKADFAKCYTAIMGDDDDAGIKTLFEPASRKTILTIVNMLLYQIDYDLDSIRRSQVVGKLALNLITSSIGAATSFIFPKVGDLSIGGAGVANFGASVINAIWDDIVDDQKFLYGLQTAMLMNFQKIAQSSGSKASLLSVYKHKFETINEEIHFKILKLCLVVATGATSFLDRVILFGGTTIKETKDIPKQILDILKDVVGNNNKYFTYNHDTKALSKTAAYTPVTDNDKNNIVFVTAASKIKLTPKSMTSPAVEGFDVAYNKVFTDASLTSMDSDNVGFNVLTDEIKAEFLKRVEVLKIRNVIDIMKNCVKWQYNTADVVNPLCVTYGQLTYTTKSLINFINSCTNEKDDVFSKIFGNNRMKFKLAASLIPKYEFTEPVLHVDFMDSPLLDAFG